MAGKMRFAAIVFLAITLLAAVGAGAYFVTSGGGWQLALIPSDGTGAPGEASSAPPAADLDAVASAWGEPTASPAATSAGSSDAARSAAVTLASASEPLTQPDAQDRYATYPSLQTPAAATEPATRSKAPVTTTSATEPTEFDPTPSVTEGLGAAANSDDQPGADSPGTAAIARGQEPKIDPNAPIPLIEPADDHEQEQAAAAASAGDVREPQMFDLPADEPTMSTAAQRARDAFRDEPAPGAADPYGSPTAQSGASRQPIGSADGNPFAANTAPGALAGGASGSLRSMPTMAPANGAALGGAAQNPSALTRPNFDQDAEPTLAGADPLADEEREATAIDGTGRPGERALEGPQKPALIIQKFAPGEIQVGKTAKFVVQVRNVGNQAADEVVIRDEVPHGTRLVSTSPSATANGNQIVWRLGKLSAGEERTLEMQLMPVAEGEVGSVATVSYAAQASVKTRCTMPQLAIRMTAAEKVLIGQEQRVKIELRNPGSGDATGVMLFENVPENVKHTAGPALEFEIGTLRAGETRELELSLLAEKAGKVVNVLTARAEGNLQVQQQVEFEVIAPALAVAIDGPERRYLERPATYEVSIENPGTAPAHDVQIVTKLPKGMRFMRANNMGEYDAATHAVYWSLAELPEGETGKVELVAMPVETGPQTLEVDGRAGQGLTDQAKQQIVVEGLAAIMFELRDLEDPIEVGGETGYEIRVVNQGTKAATNVRVAVNLPPGMQVISAEGETQHATQGAVLVFEPLPQLAPKADTHYRIKVQGIQAGDQRVTVEVVTDDLGQPIRREESTRVFGDE